MSIKCARAYLNYLRLSGHIGEGVDPEECFIRIEPIVELVGLVCESRTSCVALKREKHSRVSILTQGARLVQKDYHLTSALGNWNIEVLNFVFINLSILIVATLISEVIRNGLVDEVSTVEEASPLHLQGYFVSTSLRRVLALHTDVNRAELVAAIHWVTCLVAVDIGDGPELRVDSDILRGVILKIDSFSRVIGRGVDGYWEVRDIGESEESHGAANERLNSEVQCRVLVNQIVPVEIACAIAVPKLRVANL